MKKFFKSIWKWMMTPAILFVVTNVKDSDVVITVDGEEKFNNTKEYKNGGY